jgi:hypothetical protein
MPPLPALLPLPPRPPLLPSLLLLRPAPSALLLLL